jgi:hypothetical protein
MNFILRQLYGYEYYLVINTENDLAYQVVRQQLEFSNKKFGGT